MTGNELRTRRKACGLTQEELAARLHTRQAAVSDWEREVFPISVIVERAFNDVERERTAELEAAAVQ